MTLEENINYLAERQKLVEEELAYCHKDIANLHNLIENFIPEIHYHFTTIHDTRPCTDCKQEELEDFT